MRKSKTADRSFSFLQYDIKNAVKRNRLKVILIFLVCFVICLDYDRKVSSPAGFWNYVVYAYAGMEEYFPETGMRFEIPVYWLLLTLYAPYLTGSYAYDEMRNGFGLQALVRMKKRTGWFTGKVLYCLTCVSFFHLTVWSGFFFFSLILNSSPQLSDIALLEPLGRSLEKILPQNCFYVLLLLLPIVESVFLSVLQIVVSIVLKPVLAYLAVIVYVIASVYWRNTFLIADYTMLLRNQGDGRGVLIMVILIIAEIMIGILVFEKKDLLKQEEADRLWK
ncbi:MAG: hypothetical protein NC086_10790 [Alistipes sp.]|nr:hypothetical protein [Alistipes sp.]